MDSSKKSEKWHVYILECGDGSLYTGVTNNIKKRMKAHSNGKGSKYVSVKGFKKLLRSKECNNKSDACKQEYAIKQLPKSKKLSWFD
ncbi:GIY-YIG nuclease family protein [Candidatus Pacearchaeota archaeon]|nr:GIY-YIG nuclease family protein [Candidatus Pacearchaeota archaeon]